jgi:hypothetical protein
MSKYIDDIIKKTTKTINKIYRVRINKYQYLKMSSGEQEICRTVEQSLMEKADEWNILNDDFIQNIKNKTIVRWECDMIFINNHKLFTTRIPKLIESLIEQRNIDETLGRLWEINRKFNLRN